LPPKGAHWSRSLQATNDEYGQREPAKVWNYRLGRRSGHPSDLALSFTCGGPDARKLPDLAGPIALCAEVLQRMTMTRLSLHNSLTGLTLALVGSILSAGCGSDHGDATGSTCPSDSTLTYGNFGQSFIQANCLACHAAAESPKLNTLADIQAHLSEIDRAAAAGPNGVNTYMPDGRSVPEEERRKLGEWLACGAPK